MKKIKYLFLLLIVVLLSGCTLNYDLNIDKDLSVTEKIEASENEQKVKTITGVNSDNAINYLYEIYKRDGIKPSISSTKDGNKLIGYATVSFDSIDDYADNFTSDIFKEAKLSKSGEIYSLSFKQTEKLSNSSTTSPVYDRVNIKITLPFDVIEHNADSVKRNTYSWVISNDQELRNIKIKFDISKSNGSKIFDFGFLKINVKYNVIIFVGIIILIIGTIIFINYKSKKNNRM